MKAAPFLLSPLGLFLVRWTCLLALAWGAHWLLHRRHPRWRLIIWRSVLCFTFALPFLQFLEVPGIEIPVTVEEATTKNPVPEASVIPAKYGQSYGAAPSASHRKEAQPLRWDLILAAIWLFGFILGTARLFSIYLQLARLQKKALPAGDDLKRLARRVQLGLQVYPAVNIKISNRVTSPFVCGVQNPSIILPRSLAEGLPSAELTALLSHEFAHVRQRDLDWCVVWRWVAAVFWFHPLVWNIPGSHTFACEQEADRIASSKLADPDCYSRLLARLALRVLALPPVETSLSLNGSSQLVRRIRHLGQRGSSAWNWKLTMAGFGSAGLLFLIVAGFHYLPFGPVGFKGEELSTWYQNWDRDLAARESGFSGFSPNYSFSDFREYREKLNREKIINGYNRPGIEFKDEASFWHLLENDATSEETAEMLRPINGGTYLLMGGLQSRNERVRFYCARAFEHDSGRPWVEEAVPLLARRLNDSSDDVRIAATRALHARNSFEWLQAITHTFAPAVINNLNHPNAELRKESARLLADMKVNRTTGEIDSRHALPQLIKLLNDPVPDVRDQAQLTIACIRKLP